jgi:hypothetical protein
MKRFFYIYIRSRDLRKLDHCGVVTTFRMHLLLDLKRGSFQWKV